MDHVEATDMQISETAAANSVIGKLVAGRYRVVSELGRGGMGVVYKVEHVTLRKFMALKLLRQDHSGYANVDRIKRFQQEAKATSAVNHPNIVAVHDYGATEEGDLFLAMDFVEGKTLADEIREQGRFKPAEASVLFIQIADAMSAAHKRGLLHRDLKPSNFLIDRSGSGPSARIVDFGIAKMTKDGEDAKLTQTGELIGSPAYMSPEQCSGDQLDQRTDIYSLGCVMFETLTGISPFTAETAVQIIFKHVNERAPSFRSVAKDAAVQPELERVVLQSLEKDPQNRYQTMEDLADDLRLIQSGKNPVKEASRSRESARVVKQLVKISLLVGTIPCLMVLAALIWIQIIQHPEPWRQEAARAMDERSRANYREAIYHFRSALTQAQEAHAARQDLVKYSLELAYTYESEDNHQQSLKTLLPIVQNEHYTGPGAASVYDTIAGAYIKERDYNSALPYAEKASELKHKDKNTSKELVCNSLSKLVLIYKNLHDMGKFFPTVREYLNLEKSIHPNEDHLCVAQAYGNLAWGEMVKGDMQAAILDAGRALRIQIDVNGADSKQARQVARQLIRYYEKLGDMEHAKAVALQVDLGYPLDKEDE